MPLERRTLLRAGGLTLVAAALPLPWLFKPRSTPPSLRADPRKLLDLAPGLSYRVLESAYSEMSDGFRVPALPDGMACFDGPNDTLILMRNHEVDRQRAHGPLKDGQAMPSQAFDANAYGGVTRLVLKKKSLERVSSNLVLTGTVRNCAGGASPWGWLSCEESQVEGHGYVFLCPTDTSSVQPARRIEAYGRFNHEAAVADPKSHIAYLTEDRGDSCFYRFVPKQRSLPFAGKLQALAIRNEPDFNTARGLRPGERLEIGWVDVPNPNPSDDSVRKQARARGAARFRRGEGMFFHAGAVYFCATSGGPANAGQVFKLDPRRNQLSLVAQSESRDKLDTPDNITVTPWGHIIVAEDGSDEQFIRGIAPGGRVYDIARNAKSSGEFAGVCLAPDGSALFVNMQREGLTLAITGALKKLA